ncbi:voltage-gated potassium channel Kch [Allocatelliglobosispora scoriae]|uniref:Voltage-gated potassium channel Kch n=1 Tax=Allocatelliglobosispora scoriae TaxID=643052 RepID=A0A841BET5_9ACTN|nr:potassium transporter TrkA [Allocatelliglobosispora scoriae]MBB5866804.1 voltage-gated potassium channel Kch [Allocatelliglobosispora scoriae]
MGRRITRRARLRYWFDNTMSRGTLGLIGWLAVVSIVMVLVVTGALALVEPPGEDNPVQLLWQTFVSTFSLGAPETGTVPVLALWFVLGVGGIFIVSALVGLLTSGVNRRLEQLRKGRSQVLERDHSVILGWSDQIYTVIAELAEANKSRRSAAIAILADQDKVTMEDRVRHRLPSTGKTRLIFRTGSPLDLTDLEMVNLNEARSIIVLAPDAVSAEDADAYVLKTLLAINKGPAFQGRPHHVVASVRDSRNRTVAKLAGGDAVVIDGDDISARLIVQTARQSKLSVVYTDLFDFGGDELYMVSEPKLVGLQFGQALQAYRKCCPLGLLSADGKTTLNPPMTTVIGTGDKIVILAEDDSMIKLAGRVFPIDEASIVHAVRGPAAPESTLILGWNGRATRIIEQLDVYVAEGSTVDIVTDRSDADTMVVRLAPRLRRLMIRSKGGDTRDRTVLETLDVGSYHNVIVLSDDLLDPMTADSRVLVTLLHLRDLLAGGGRSGSIVSEMRDDRDRALAQLTKADDFVVSEQLVSLLMTQISENRHLESVFVDLFDPDGAEIYIRPANYYLRPAPGFTFATAVEAARRRGEVAIGYRVAEPGDGHGVVLNPDKDVPMPVIDRLIVLSNS